MVYGYNIVAGVTSQEIGDVGPNTDYIIAAQGEVQTSYAAGLAKTYSGGGYTDWFLPSKDELIKMQNNRDIITTTALANGGGSFESHPKAYWSSSESSIDMVHGYYFGDCGGVMIGKNGNMAVRPVRYF